MSEINFFLRNYNPGEQQSLLLFLSIFVHSGRSLKVDWFFFLAFYVLNVGARYTRRARLGGHKGARKISSPRVACPLSLARRVYLARSFVSRRGYSQAAWHLPFTERQLYYEVHFQT